MSRPIYFVSLGPGDAELITLKIIACFTASRHNILSINGSGARQNLVTCRHPVT